MSLNLSIPLRAAVLTNSAVTSVLSTYQGVPAVFTRRPVPADADYPMAIVSPDISIADFDALKSRRPIVRRDLTIVGLQPDQYRTVEDVGYAWRAQFHRQKFSVSITGFGVVDIVCTGPMPSAVDNDKEVARSVLLQLRLRDLST